MQLLAMLTMLIDHVGLVFFPDQEIWRIIGRIAFPLYVYALVQGYNRTSSKPRYIIRLSVIALLSQIPYQLALASSGLNVVVSLLAGVIVLLLLDRTESFLISVFIAAGAGFIMEMFPFDYGAYGLILILIFRYAPVHWLVPWHLMLNILYMYLNGWFLQMWSLFPTVLYAYGPAIWRSLERIRVRSWMWRSFYPLHLSLIAVIKWL
ncbi:TraX family protein [Paenibacillus dakarensis]|uniref:TraX family protein n=1 Tax=Paenibacillus dakarensis TaxID=1527293 RepID=UPI0006D53F9E|nr:TraX family protein [Paenibacillus dakarensis]